MPRSKPAAVYTARPDASGSFVVEPAARAVAVPATSLRKLGAAPAHRVSTRTGAQVASAATGRVKLTEAIVARLEAHLTAQGRDLGKACDVWDDVVRGLLLRRERSGRKTWSLRVHVAGRRSRVTLGTWPGLGVAAAREAATVRAAEVAKGADPIAVKRAAKVAEGERRNKAARVQAERLGAFVEGRYRQWAEAHLRSHAATLGALKVDFGEGGKRKRGRGWWNKPMSAITPWDVESWRAAELKAGRKPATIRRAWQRLRAVLGRAHALGMLDKPPINVEWKGAFKRPKRSRVRYLTPEERAQLTIALEAREQRRRDERTRMRAWQEARGLDLLPEHGAFTDHLMPLVLLVLNTGMRRGEALKLTWGAINLARGTLHIAAETAKSGEDRDLPLNAQARAVLEAMRDQQQPTRAGAYLFALPDGSRLQSVTKSWDGLVKAAGIRGLRFHDLRHDFASQLVMQGVSLNTVRELLGHGDVAMTLRYAHLAPGHLAEAVRRLDVPAVTPAPPIPSAYLATLSAVQ